MLKDFINGNKRGLCTNDLYDFFTEETLQEIEGLNDKDKQYLRKKKNYLKLKIFPIEFMEDYIYGISVDYSDTISFYIDDKRKNILISKTALLYELGMYSFFTEKVDVNFRTKFEDYKIYVLDDILSEINNFIDKSFKEIVQNEREKIIKEVEEKYSYSGINHYIEDKYLLCYIKNAKNEYMNLIKSFHYEYSDLSLIYSFILDKDNKKNELIDVLHNAIYNDEKSSKYLLTNIYKYYMVESKLSLGNKNVDRTTFLYKEIYNCMNGDMKSITVVGQNGLKVKVAPKFKRNDEYKYIGDYRECVYTSDIKQITYGKKILFDINDFEEKYKSECL